MSLVQTIKEDIKQAMRDKNTPKLTALRGVSAAFTNESVTLGRTPSDELSDAEAIAVIKREVKRRRDAIEQFTAGGREDLAENDRYEVEVLSIYLPAAMSLADIRTIAEAKIAEFGGDKTKVGQITGAIMKEANGLAEAHDVKAVLEELLG